MRSALHPRVRGGCGDCGARRWYHRHSSTQHLDVLSQRNCWRSRRVWRGSDPSLGRSMSLHWRVLLPKRSSPRLRRCNDHLRHNSCAQQPAAPSVQEQTQQSSEWEEELHWCGCARGCAQHRGQRRSNRDLRPEHGTVQWHTHEAWRETSAFQCLQTPPAQQRWRRGLRLQRVGWKSKEHRPVRCRCGPCRTHHT